MYCKFICISLAPHYKFFLSSVYEDFFGNVFEAFLAAANENFFLAVDWKIFDNTQDRSVFDVYCCLLDVLVAYKHFFGNV